jgi:hypothetical protein
MATNSFTEFNLAEAQQLADYTSIQVDLQSACEFARTMLAEMHRPSPNYSLADPLWSQRLFDMRGRFLRVFG